MARVFDTANFAPQDRREAYMSAFAGSEVPKQVGFPAGVELSATMDLWDLGPGLHLIRASDNGLRLTRSTRHLRIAAPERIGIAYQRREAAISIGPWTQRLRPGDLHVVDQTLPSDFVGYGVGGSQSFNFDYDVLGLPIDLGRRAVVAAAASPMYEMFRRHMEHVCSALDDLQHDEDALLLVGAATMDLARALLATTSDQRSLQREVLHSTELTRIRVYIDQHLQDTDLNLRSIAKANHVSLRQFYKVWGSSRPTPSEYIMGERLRRAHDDLARADLTSQSIFTIARKWGFTDSAHFSRRFKDAYGITPRDWRQLNHPV